MKLKIPPKIPASKKWVNVLCNNYKFQYVQDSDNIPDVALWSTSCSKTKSSKPRGFPRDFYLGRYNKLFYKYTDLFNLEYGIISDKYGIHMKDECLDYYDIHPANLSIEDKYGLGRIVHDKVLEHGFKEIIFYYPSPLQSIPYFEILWFSQLSVNYISNIKILEKKD